jgi:hypothetical protein
VDRCPSNLPIDGHSFRRVEVLTGTPRRRRWSADEKAVSLEALPRMLANAAHETGRLAAARSFDPKDGIGRAMPEIESRHARVGGSATFPLVYGQVTFIGEWRHDDDREHPACPQSTENQLPALYLAALHRAHRAGAIERLAPASLTSGPQIGLSGDVSGWRALAHHLRSVSDHVGGCPRGLFGVGDHRGVSGADFALASFGVGTEDDPPPDPIKL